MKSGWLRVTSLIACAISVAACSKKSASSSAESASAPSGSGAAAAQPAASAGSAAVCTVSARTVWAKWANQRTGITATQLSGGRVALGVAVGDDPAVLVFDGTGKGELHRIGIAKDLPLGSDMKKADGRRDLQRVTPGVEADGDLVAYADYRDRWNKGRRRVACGRADTKQQLFEFDGTPLLDAKKPTAVATTAQTGVAHAGVPPTSALAPPHLALPGVHKQAVQLIKPMKPMATLAPSDKKPESEIRDCRSFVEPGGKDAWAAATELHGDPQADGSTKWSMRLLVIPRAGAAPQSIYKVDLPAQPKKLETFETAVAAQRPGGGYALFARYNGGLLAWTLDGNHARQSGPRHWGGGYPSPPRVTVDGNDLVAVTALKHGASDFLPRFARIGMSGLPAAQSPIAIAGAGSDVSEPVLVRTGDQRWLAYHASSRRAGELKIVPVDDKLASVGRSFDVTADGESAYESFIFALGNGQLLVVYVQGGSPSQLVSEQLSCHVAS